jgi:protein transport protein SEC20
MPPLPLTTQTLAARLNSLSESHKAALQLIQRLSKLDFQPGVNPSKSEDGDARLELTAEIHASLNQLDEELELLRQEVEEVVQSGVPTARRRDSVRETEKSRLAVLLARLTEDLKSYGISIGYTKTCIH